MYRARQNIELETGNLLKCNEKTCVIIVSLLRVREYKKHSN